MPRCSATEEPLCRRSRGCCRRPSSWWNRPWPRCARYRQDPRPLFGAESAPEEPLTCHSPHEVPVCLGGQSGVSPVQRSTPLLRLTPRFVLQPSHQVAKQLCVFCQVRGGAEKLCSIKVEPFDRCFPDQTRSLIGNDHNGYQPVVFCGACSPFFIQDVEVLLTTD